MKKKINYNWQEICPKINEIRSQSNPILSRLDWIKKLTSVGCPKTANFFTLMYKNKWLIKVDENKHLYQLCKVPIFKGTFESICTKWLEDHRSMVNKSAKKEPTTAPIKPEENPTLARVIDVLTKKGYIIKQDELRSIKTDDVNNLITYVRFSGYKVYQIQEVEVK